MIVDLPSGSGGLLGYELRPRAFRAEPGPAPEFSRLAFAAAHVVARRAPSGRSADPRAPEAIDWDATLRFRRHLWSLGFGIAEAMDTAQREILGWPNSARLMERTLSAAREAPGRLVIGGAGTDHLDSSSPTIAQIIDAYLYQAEWIHERGGRAILFPTSHLPQRYPQPEHYVQVYREVSVRVSKPVFVHWLGESFAPALKGYFPGDSFWQIMADNPGILGVKISLLDRAVEEQVRRRLAAQGQVVLTGDDFNYAELMLGTEAASAKGDFEFEGRSFPLADYSHALLGIFDAIAPVASRALARLAAGDVEAYRRLLAPTVPLSRHIFCEPTYLYKAGLVFLAYLNGHQPDFHLLDQLETKRDVLHYAELFRLADAAGLLDDPAGAYERFLPLLHAAGFRAARPHA